MHDKRKSYLIEAYLKGAAFDLGQKAVGMDFALRMSAKL